MKTFIEANLLVPWKGFVTSLLGITKACDLSFSLNFVYCRLTLRGIHTKWCFRDKFQRHELEKDIYRCRPLIHVSEICLWNSLRVDAPLASGEQLDNHFFNFKILLQDTNDLLATNQGILIQSLRCRGTFHLSLRIWQSRLMTEGCGCPRVPRTFPLQLPCWGCSGRHCLEMGKKNNKH